jgi:hypothetical protein
MRGGLRHSSLASREAGEFFEGSKFGAKGILQNRAWKSALKMERKRGNRNAADQATRSWLRARLRADGCGAAA